MYLFIVVMVLNIDLLLIIRIAFTKNGQDSHATFTNNLILTIDDIAMRSYATWIHGSGLIRI